ncbi:GP46-like surface antigen, putative [Bodo saltans]|uniref:GP46-like surface antigen, putative n=1 Tax=Bodo saltans TaxID=75058 RepID=A0A0S4J3U1_BODSA|nr:GP46-like surface antigen, putative [Bodo saltans]|eukprot:CUG71827.1 GP46-like surface antigen, putative [Bodo saltans]
MRMSNGRSCVHALLASLLVATVNSGAFCGCEDDFDTLMEFYNSTDGPNWKKNNGWGVKDPCQMDWYGLSCDDVLGVVGAIDLTSNNLAGTIPDSFANLTSLTSLRLTHNSLNGTLSAQWANMTSLTTLALDQNRFTGALPPEWGSLSELQSLNLQSNRLSGSLPPEWHGLDRLVTLALDRNMFTGNLPADWGLMVALQTLDVQSNQLSGSLPPEWNGLGFLITSMYLNDNSLEGTLPDVWGDFLSGLTRFCANKNLLSGALPESWGAIDALQELQLEDNRFSGELPSEWHALLELETLSLARNYLNGSLPESWGRIRSLTVLNLRSNFFSGTLPDAWKTFRSLQSLFLDDNQLTGSLPSSWSEMKSLMILSLRGNFLVGDLPANWSAIPSLASIDLGENQLTGGLPASWATMPSLSLLDVSNNQLGGVLPSVWSDSGGPHTLNLSHNQLSGTFPDNLTKVLFLEVVDLSSNRLSGPLPAGWITFTHLTNLALDDNDFSGTLPDSWASFTALGTLSLARNQLTGTLPTIWNLWGLAAVFGSCVFRTLILSGNSLSGTLPSTWSLMSCMSLLMLDHNQLSGTLPASWSSIGSNLHGIEIILDHNMFEGELPGAWGPLASRANTFSVVGCGLSGMLPEQWLSVVGIRRLLLSENSFRGAIPSAWAILGDVEIINVSNNCLDGVNPWLHIVQENEGIVDTCNTHILPSSLSCQHHPSVWPQRCNANRTTRSATLFRTFSDELDHQARASSPSQTLHDAHHIRQTSQVTLMHRTSTSTLVEPLSNLPLPLPTVTVAAVAASAPLAATAVVGAVSSADPGSAQALLTTLQSPCAGPNAQQSTPRASSLALSPLVLFGDEGTIGAFEVVVGNTGISVAIMFLHFMATRLLLYYHDDEERVNEVTHSDSFLKRVACSTAGARLRFPSLSLKFVAFLMPGVVWAMSSLLSDADTMDAAVVGIGVVVVFGALGAFWYSHHFVLHRWILASEEVEEKKGHGLLFVRFRNAGPFSPPIPKALASIICSRDGQWGPRDRRAAFGSPMASVFLPDHVRWIWMVSPGVSLIAVGLSTARPPTEHDGPACDAIQSVLVVLFLSTSLLFAWLRPHRSMLRSLLCSFSSAHNGLVVILAMLFRHHVVEQNVMFVAASGGAYVSLAVTILVLGIEILENRILGTSLEAQQANSIRCTWSEAKVVPTITQKRKVSQRAALEFLLRLACSSAADTKIPEYL